MHMQSPTTQISEYFILLRSVLSEMIAHHFHPVLIFFMFLSFQLASHVPSSTWVLAYSTFLHGTSLKTLYYRLREVETPVMLVVKDDNGFVSIEGH